MAAKYFYRQGFLLLLFNFISTAALEKRFSDFKRCADEECSMLLCRGKAVKDFSGPDCRFLSFKESETIYVYYKLSGRRTDMWAGSIGSNFGYFPKDLLAINHIYTNQEFEISAEETDFVCFDTGYDKFDNYDIDVLLASSLEESDREGKETSDQSQVAKGAQNETQPLAEETNGREQQTNHNDSTEDFVQDGTSASLPELEIDMESESPSSRKVETETAATPDVNERPVGDADVVKKNTVESVLKNIESERSKTKDIPAKSEVESVAEVDVVSGSEPVSISEGVPLPELKTTYGSTFDAVTTDEDLTKNVTPYEEDESKPVGSPFEDNSVKVETPLLSFSEETINTPAPDYLRNDEIPPTTQDDKQDGAEEKNMWTSLGDAVFSVVTGGETTTGDFSSDEDDEEEKEVASKITHSFEEAKEDVEDPGSVELPKEPENMEPVLRDPPSYVANEERNSDPEELLFDRANESEGVVAGPGESLEETLKPTDESPRPVDPVPQKDTPDVPEVPDVLAAPDVPAALISDLKTAEEPIEYKEEEEEVSSYLEFDDEHAGLKDGDVAIELGDDLGNELAENKMGNNKELASTETHLDPSTQESENSVVGGDEDMVIDSIPDQIRDHLLTDVESNMSQAELPVEEPEIDEEHFPEKLEDDKYTEIVEEEEKEELLEDENALSLSQSNNTDSVTPSPETTLPTVSTPETQYSDNVMRLTLLRDHFTEEKMERLQKLLGLKNLFKVEAMFSDLDVELQATRHSHTSSTQDVENALERILEASENTILDEIEKMLDGQGTKPNYEQHMDTSTLDEETEILDDFQELAFSLRQKYSTASDSTPLATEKKPDIEKDEHGLNVKDDTPHMMEEDKADAVSEAVHDDNLTLTDHSEKPAEPVEDQIVLDEAHSAPDIIVEEDGGHFNKNKDNRPSFSASEEIQNVPEAFLESSLDKDLGVEVEHSPSASEIREEEGLLSTGTVFMGCILSLIKTKIVEWTIEIISLLPEEWKPGETFFGCPWQAVIITALVGVVTFTLFFWRTVLAVKKKEYLVDEKRMKEQIESLKKEKNDAVTKMSELQKQTEQLKENQKQSKEKVSCTMKKIQALENKVLEAKTLSDNMVEEKNKYAKLLEEERTASLQNETKIEKLEKSNEKLLLSRKKIQEALTKTTVLLDEAKIREDARNVQHKCLEKEYAALKEENKTFKVAIKGWEDKHKELNEQIKVYQKSQKELEDSVVLKDHNVEVLSELMADLDACDPQKGDAKVLANGEVAPDKKTIIKNRIKQMMDVSRVQTTLTVVEEERDRFMTKLLNEEKARKSLEEQHQELEHAIATLKSEKSHVENQFKILQQKNEIMVEMYQQKENALQQRLTKEELERRSKENMLSEVGGKALEAEEQVKVLRQRINEMEEQMKKTEEVYKEQIKEQENKTHSNWVNARNAERALNQEKLESSKLREKLAVLTSQLNERRAPLFRPNSGQPAGPRQGDSYGPSPVSGGAPSPPLMIEGPRRPPSAPVGRRIDPYGPRPPSDPHGRYPENKHIPAMDMMGPRSSSPANMDASTQAVDEQLKTETQAEVSTDSPVPGPGSFLASPIRDSPGPAVQGLPHGPGPHEPLLPPGRLPPPGSYRPPRPGVYQLPPGPHGPPPPHGPPLSANGHPSMPMAGSVGGELGPRPSNGHPFHPRLGPGPVVDPRGPPMPHFRPPPPHHFGPMAPPPGVRGPMGPRPTIPPDMRFPGPRELTNPPMNLHPGVPPHPSHGDVYGQAPPNALQYSAGDHSSSGVKQEDPQDSVRPAMAEP